MDSEKGIFHENRDPISNAPGAHPIGTGIGAAGAGAAGMAIGAAVGPIGALIGATVGSVVGGLLGKGIAEVIDPTAEEAFWRDKHPERPYYQKDYTFEDDYLPAYRYGWESRSITGDHSFEDLEPPLKEGWTHARKESRFDWDKARPAVKDAWAKVERDRLNKSPRETLADNESNERLPRSGGDISYR